MYFRLYVMVEIFAAGQLSQDRRRHDNCVCVSLYECACMYIYMCFRVYERMHVFVTR